MASGREVVCDLKQARIWVKRSKNSLDTEQAIEGDELRAIKRYLAQGEERLPWLFVSERGQPMTRQAVNYLIGEAGERAGLGRVWPHMLRHSAGYALSNKGHDFRLLQDFMGHRDPRHTSRYTRTASRRLEVITVTAVAAQAAATHLPFMQPKATASGSFWAASSRRSMASSSNEHRPFNTNSVLPCNSISMARTSKSLRLLAYQPQYNEEMAAS